MNKFLSKIAALSVGLAMAIGVGVAVGSNRSVKAAEADSMVLDFKKATGDGSLITTSTTAGSVLNAGTSYVTTTPFSSISYTYGGGSGLKVGKSGAPGSITIALASAVTPTSIVVNAARYNGSKTTSININSNGDQSVSSTTASNFTFNITTSIDSLVVTSTSNYCWVYSITINYSSGGGGEESGDDSSLITDELLITTFGVTSGYTGFTSKSASNTGHSSAVYLGCVGRNGNATKYNIQLNSGQTSPYYRGIATSTSGGIFRKIAVTWATQTSNIAGRYLSIYGSNTAFSSNTSDYASGLQPIATITYQSNATTGEMSEYTAADYRYVAIKASGAIYMDQINVYWEEPLALSSVSTSGQTTTFDEGDNFAYGGTLTATYSDSSSTAVTPTSYKYGASGIDPTSAGTAITTSDTLSVATHNGKYIYVLYIENNVTKYASYQITVSAAAVPFINLTATSGASAYTGQTVSISATYGGGVAGLNWSVQSGSISGAATTSNSGYSAKISNTAGTLTIRATDTGSALYSEVSVTVTKTAFTTSPAASASVAEGKTTTLTAVLNSGGTINWESDDNDVATVSNGVVTGVAAGTATITAQSADDTSVTATCTVTVTEAPAEVIINKDNITNFAGSYAERDWIYGTGANAISGKIKAYKNSDNIQMNSNNTCYVYNTDAIKGYITGITFTRVSGSKKLTCWVGTSVLSSDPVEAGSANDTYTWSFDANDHYTYFRVATKDSSGAIAASAITITYQKVQTVNPTGITLDDSSTVNMDTYGYGRRRLVATVEPFNANDKTVTWGTSDSSIVTVENGVLTATGVGTATVYATTVNYISDVATPDLKASVTVNVEGALYKKATFVPTSTSAATQTDDCLEDGTVELSAKTAGTYHNDKSAIQLASGKDVTFTISGYAGMKISGIDLIMSSNASAGTGALTVTAGTTEILEIESATFDDPSWNGAYDANACDLYRATTEYVVKSGETIKFAFSASANSIFIHSIAIRYLDYSLEQWCENFLEQITCSGGTPGSITDDSNWDDLGLVFLDLDEELQDIAAHATANKDSENVIEQAMARYDLILRKYGIGTGAGQHDDFIGRFGAGTINGFSNSPITINQEDVSSIIVISTVTLVSVAAVGGYFLLRKRKEF